MNGAELIAAERTRQVGDEGWTDEHDAEHKDGELTDAAQCYLRVAYAATPVKEAPVDWPWEDSAWKPDWDDPTCNLVKAGALIAAEIDRIHRDGF